MHFLPCNNYYELLAEVLCLILYGWEMEKKESKSLFVVDLLYFNIGALLNLCVESFKLSNPGF